MAKTILSASHSNSEPGTTVAGTTEYWLFGYTSFEKSTTEATREVLYRAPGTLSKLYVRLTANTTSTNGSITIRKNGADTALTVTVTAGSGAVELEDTSDTLSVAAGDKLCIKTVSGGTGTFTMTMVSCIWDATTNTSVRYVAKGYSITSATAAYLPIAGDRSGTTGTEANVENTIKTAGTLKNLATNVTSNARTTASPFAARKNRTTTALVTSYGSTEIGHKEDTSNAISYAVDDELDYVIDPGTGSTAIVLQSLAVDYETTTDQGVLTRGCVGTTADFIQDTDLTWYVPIGGGNREAVTTESQVQMKAREAFTFRNLVAYSNANTIANSTTVALRVNGSTTALSASFGPAATGFVSDVSDTVTVAAGDLINFIVITDGGVGQTISIRQIGITTELVPSGVAVERALTTETISISEAAFTRLAAKTRIRTDTAIAVSENRARLAEKMRPLSTQTTALSENVIRIKGKVKTLATETITVTGGTLARLLAKLRTPAANDTTTISESRQRLGSKSRPLSTQSVALSESLQRIKGKIKSLTLETITVGGGTLARLSSKIRAISLQTVILTDNRTRLKTSMRTLATQTITLSEDIARTVARQVIRALATQTVSIGESITRLKVSQRLISQTIILADNAARLTTKLRAISLQTIALSESRTRIKGAVKAIPQTVLLSENIIRLSAKLRTIATQTVALADNVTRQIIGGAVEITRALSQTVALSETVGRRLAVQRILIQTSPTAESLVRVRGVLRTLSQNIPVSESLSRIKSASKLISQTLISSDSISRLNTITRSIIQTTVLASSVARETVGNLVRSLVETITVSDSIARRTAKLVILAQAVAITEQARRLSTKLRTIPAQTIMLSDSVTQELNVIIKNAIKAISQLITITDYAKIEVVKKSQRFRKILQPSIKRLISNHPAWLLGTRGMHNDYEEFSP